MLIGIPKEIKPAENRVGMTPAGVRELLAHGHRVLVERHAGLAAGFDDQLYQQQGAVMVESAEELFSAAELIVKVKEPQPDECRRLRAGQLLFAYLHLAPDPQQAGLLMASGASCIAYETVQGSDGSLPLLAPMSEVAGRLAVQSGAHCMEAPQQGCGVLLSGVPGVLPANVLILGGGVAGEGAAQIAMGMGASVTVLDRSLPRLRELQARYHGRLKTGFSTRELIETLLPDAHLVIGSVLVPGALAPKLIDRTLLGRMRRGAVLVDIAIDQGGCFESSRPTTHHAPTFVEQGVVHYCVSNMPGAVPATATQALSHATLPYVLQLAEHGIQALQENAGLAAGLNVHRGQITHPAVAEALGVELGRVELH